MIELLFKHNISFILVRIKGHNIEFANTTYGAKVATFEGLALDYSGVIKEFPDLENDPQWRTKTIERFKTKINSMSSEDDIAFYIVDDLTKFGYKLLSKTKDGFRPVRIRDDTN